MATGCACAAALQVLITIRAVVQGPGPNAFAALVGGPRVPAPGSSPANACVAASDILGHQSGGGPGSSGGGFAAASPAAAVAAGLASPAVVNLDGGVVTVSAGPAATPLVAPSAASRGVAAAPSPEACATIGPEIRAAAADPAVTGTLAAAAAALHCEGEVPHVMLSSCEAAEPGDPANLAYALPRALWPPAPVAVAAQQEPPSSAAAEQQPQSGEVEVGVQAGVMGAAAAVGSGKVTPQVQI